MIISGNSIQARVDVAVFAVRDGAGGAVQLVDPNNSAVNNPVLLTLVREYVAGGGAGPTMRFRIQNVFYAVDFTRLGGA
jgi:hypothetical protein